MKRKTSPIKKAEIAAAHLDQHAALWRAGDGEQFHALLAATIATGETIAFWSRDGKVAAGAFLADGGAPQGLGDSPLDALLAYSAAVRESRLKFVSRLRTEAAEKLALAAEQEAAANGAPR